MSARFDRSEIRRKARDVFAGADGRRSATDVAFELKEICGLHRTVVGGGGHSEEALLRLGGAVREFAAQISRLEYAGIADPLGRELADTLAVAFRRTHSDRDADLRSQLLADMWALVELDLDRGRDPWVVHLHETFREDTTASERAEVIDWFRDPLASVDDTESQRLVGHWMLEYVGDDLSDEEFDAMCRNTGQYERLVERALGDDRVEQALEWVAEAPAERIAQLCRLFRDVDRLPRLVDADVLPDPDPASLSSETRRDVAVMLLEIGAVETALPWALSSFHGNRLGPTLRELREATEVADAYGPRLEDELLEGLRSSAPAAVFDFHLEFGELGEAFDVWEDDKYWSQEDRGPAADRLLEASEDRGAADIAVAVATARADVLVERRGRDNYADACDYLAAARRVVQSGSVPLEWKMLIGEYEDRIDRLPAFRDEAESADLLP